MIDIELQFGALRVAITWPSRSQPAPAGEGTSAADAAIVRRICALCPDGRFDGGADAELLDLFKRNRRILERSDEDVIATMTRPR